MNAAKKASFVAAYKGNFSTVFATRKEWDPDVNRAAIFADPVQAKLHGEAILGGLLSADRETSERLVVLPVSRRWVVQP